MRKAERQAYVSRRSEELAQTGRFAGWIEIEFELRFNEGYPEARGWLDSRMIRDRLDMLCARSQKEAHDA